MEKDNTVYVLIDNTAVGYICPNNSNNFSVLHASGLRSSVYRYGHTYSKSQAKTIEVVNREYTEQFSNICIADFKN